MRISIEEKHSLVARYQAGESVSDICADSGVPKSTFYTWIKPYTVTMTDSGHAVSQQAFIKMKQKLQKLEKKIEILNKVVQSFSKSSRPHDNAVAESFFASMKREEIYRTQYCSERQFMQSVDTYIEFYNTKRPHSTLNYRTPDRFELLHAQRKERTG